MSSSHGNVNNNVIMHVNHSGCHVGLPDSITSSSTRFQEASMRLQHLAVAERPSHTKELHKHHIHPRSC